MEVGWVGFCWVGLCWVVLGLVGLGGVFVVCGLFLWSGCCVCGVWLNKSNALTIANVK